MKPSEQVAYLTGLADKLLLHEKKIPIELTKEWANKFPEYAGVYVIYENENILYIGETGYLRGRMTDLLDTRNHSFRRTIGKKRFSNEATYYKATTSRKFSDEIEFLINDYIIHHLTISSIEVSLGRKELEEYLISKYLTAVNLKSKRKGKQMSMEKKEVNVQMPIIFG